MERVEEMGLCAGGRAEDQRSLDPQSCPTGCPEVQGRHCEPDLPEAPAVQAHATAIQLLVHIKAKQ